MCLVKKLGLYGNVLYFCFGISKVEQAEEVRRITVIKVWVGMAAADKDTIEGPFSFHQSWWTIMKKN